MLRGLMAATLIGAISPSGSTPSELPLYASATVAATANLESLAVAEATRWTSRGGSTTHWRSWGVTVRGVLSGEV